MTDDLTDDAATGNAETRLSIDEVVRLARRLDVGVPLHLGPLMPADLDPATVDEIAAAVDRGLLARDLLRVEGDQVLVEPEVAGLVSFIASPGLLVRLDVERDGGATTDVVYAQPDRAVLERLDETGVLGYTPLAVADILPFVVARTGLDDRPAPRGHPFWVPVSAVTAAGAALAQGEDADAAAAPLVEAGADAGSARAYVAAQATHVSACGVTTIHRADGPFTATVTAWSDCGAAGLWLLDQPDAPAVFASAARRPVDLGDDVARSLVSVEGLSGGEILERVLAGFPGVG